MEYKTNSYDKRLAWKCRRGMLELDILFRNFLETGYNGLKDEHKNLFEEMLEHPDQILQGWLIFDHPAKAEYEYVIKEIRLAIKPKD